MSGKPKDKRLFLRILADFVDHPKVMEAITLGGAEAGWLWLCALSWSRRKLTDGRLPDSAVRTLAAAFTRTRFDKVADALVKAGLWKRAEGGYEIHDFTDFAPTKEQVEAKRAAAKTAMRTIRGQKPPAPPPSGRDVSANMPPTSDQHADNMAPCSTDVRPMFSPVTEVSEVSDPPMVPQGTGEGSPDVDLDPTEAQLFVAYAKGLSEALGTLTKPSRTEANAYALTELWGTVGYPEGYAAADFLARLPGKVREYVHDAQRRGQPDHFEGFYSPKRFLDYTKAVLAGRDPWPGLATSADGKPRQGGKAANGGGMSSPYGDPTAEDIARMTGRAS